MNNIKLTPAKVKFLKEFFKSENDLKNFFDSNPASLQGNIEFLTKYEEGKHCPISEASASLVHHEWDNRCETSVLIEELGGVTETELPLLDWGKHVRTNKELLCKIASIDRPENWTPDEVVERIRSYL